MEMLINTVLRYSSCQYTYKWWGNRDEANGFEQVLMTIPPVVYFPYSTLGVGTCNYYAGRIRHPQNNYVIVDATILHSESKC